MSNCKDKLPCGCNDHPVGTPPPCEQGTITCPNPDPCAETFSAGCVVYTGDSIVDLGITRGDRMDVIVQRLALFLTNPSCVDPTSSCLAILGLASTGIGTSTVALSWLMATTATGYTVAYKQTGAVSWTLNPSLGPLANPTDTIAGLLPNTEYDIRVNATCASGSCYSVTIRVKTNIL